MLEAIGAYGLKTWDKQLALIEISYDNNYHFSIGKMNHYMVGGVELPYSFKRSMMFSP